jgi:choline dehydrogenase-like flavoprotein
LSATRLDAIVIGSGAGGAPVARRLAERGMRVAVLEEGEAHDRSEHTGRPRDMLPLLYRSGGQTATVGNPPIMLPLGRGLGGTTAVNSGTCFRAPDRILNRWQQDLGIELDEHYAQVEREIHVRRVTEDIAGRNALIAKRGAEALGWSGRFLDRNAKNCVGSGVCAFGCPTGAKQHTGETYMRWARDAGAQIHTRTRAKRILIRDGHAHGVETSDGRTLTADRVIVSAGTIHTPALLAASGIRHPELGRNLSIHPATAAWAVMDEDVDMVRGVPQSYCVDEFADEGLMFEGVAGPPDYLAMAVPFAGDRHRELMLRYRQIAQFGLMVSDTSRGRVKRKLIRYDLNKTDTATIKRGIERLAELLFAAGAKAVYVPVAGVGELRDLAPLKRARITPAKLKLMAFHPLGTARAGAVLDADLKVAGTENLFVSDGSAVPSALGVNPQLTIMALATRLGEHLCRS